MLPKFLIADNSQEQPDMIYVVHTEEPRCFIASDIEDFTKDQEIFWIDEAPSDVEMVSDLLIEAEKFLERELEHQADLLDEE